MDVLTNTGEFYVHHEDIRRARKGWEPRNILPELEAQLWNVCKPLAHSPSMRNEGPLIVRAPGNGELHVGNTDEGAAVLEGKPSELVMYLFGRKDHAQVSLRS